MRRVMASFTRPHRRAHSGVPRCAALAPAPGAGLGAASGAGAAGGRPNPLSTCTPASQSESMSAVQSAGWCAGCDDGGCDASVSTTCPAFARPVTTAHAIARYTDAIWEESVVAGARGAAEAAAVGASESVTIAVTTGTPGSAPPPTEASPSSVLGSAWAPTARALASASCCFSASGSAVGPAAAQAAKSASNVASAIVGQCFLMLRRTGLEWCVKRQLACCQLPLSVAGPKPSFERATATPRGSMFKASTGAGQGHAGSSNRDGAGAGDAHISGQVSRA